MKLQPVCASMLAAAALCTTGAVHAAANNYFEIYNGALSENFSVDFSGPAQTWGDIDLSTYSRTQATAVPEPATYGMLLAGLGIVGLRRHRRSKNR